jgi:hypothetical protein
VSTAFAVLKVHWMVAVEVCAVGRTKGVLRPEGSDIASRVEPERIRVLAESVQVGIVRQPGSQTEVLGLEDKWCRRTIKKHLAGPGT